VSILTIASFTVSEERPFELDRVVCCVCNIIVASQSRNFTLPRHAVSHGKPQRKQDALVGIEGDRLDRRSSLTRSSAAQNASL
jgi:hypothetical protein